MYFCRNRVVRLLGGSEGRRWTSVNATASLVTNDDTLLALADDAVKIGEMLVARNWIQQRQPDVEGVRLKLRRRRRAMTLKPGVWIERIDRPLLTTWNDHAPAKDVIRSQAHVFSDGLPDPFADAVESEAYAVQEQSLPG